MNGPKPALQSLIEEVLEKRMLGYGSVPLRRNIEDTARDIVLAIQRAGGIKAFMEGHSMPNLITYVIRYMPDVELHERFDLLDTQQVIDIRRQDNFLFELTLLERQV